MSSSTVAETILAQLGGNRFITMTGAKNFVYRPDALSFDLPRGSTANKATRCVIYLNGDDLYDVGFYRWNPRTLNMDDRSAARGVQCTDLREVFTGHTGLHTNL